jgi:integral membrane protein
MFVALERFEKKRPFNDSAAWFLFKVAAFSEAFGWTLLITGILIKRYITPSSNLPVLIAGRMHGVFFFIYIIAAIGLYTSLRWSRKRVFIAALASVPPYGSLFFEQWAAYKRRAEKRKAYREIGVYAIIAKNQTVLAIKPRHSGYYNLPGGRVEPSETTGQSLPRQVKAQIGDNATVGKLLYVLQYRQKKVEKLDLFFSATLITKSNPSFSNRPKEINEIDYIKPLGNESLLPAFLRSEEIVKASKARNSEVKFISSLGKG